MAFFCNVIIFYCFLELLETPTVFFKKILISGQCYTFVHQNCATDLMTLREKKKGRCVQTAKGMHVKAKFKKVIRCY